MIILSVRQRSRIHNWFAAAKEFFPADTIQKAEEIFAVMDSEGGLMLSQLEDLCRLFVSDQSEGKTQAQDQRTYKMKSVNKSQGTQPVELLISYLLNLRQSIIMAQHTTDSPIQRR